MDVLESLIVQHCPMEAVLPSPTSKHGRQAKAVLERNRVLLTNRANLDQSTPFKRADLDRTEADILKVMPAESKHLLETSTGLALKALSHLVLNTSDLSVEQLNKKIRF